MEVDARRMSEPIQEENKQVQGSRTHSPKCSKVLEAYFYDHIKPSEIAKRFKIDRVQVYAIVERSKKQMTKRLLVSNVRESTRRIISAEAKALITQYCISKANRHFTIDSIAAYLATQIDVEEVPSRSWINKFVKR
jgi:transposase